MVGEWQIAGMDAHAGSAKAVARGTIGEATRSAASPDAMHVRHDHRTAGTEFLHIFRIALAYGVRSRIVARIDLVALIIWRDAQPGRRPAVLTRRRPHILRRSLRDLDRGRRRLCGSVADRPRNSACKND